MAQAAILGTYVVVRPCIYVWTLRYLGSNVLTYRPLRKVWFIASALSDILIAVAMTSLVSDLAPRSTRQSNWLCFTAKTDPMGSRAILNLRFTTRGAADY
jgi:hypothetical protein